MKKVKGNKSTITKKRITMKKGLQKFTNFEAIKTNEEILKLYQEQPKELPKLLSFLKAKSNQAQAGQLSEGMDLYVDLVEYATGLQDPEQLPAIRRLRWQFNKVLIENCLHEYLTRYGRMPQHREIVDSTKLSRVTVLKHMEAGAGAMMHKEEIESHKLLTSKVLGMLYKIGMETGNIKALKVYLDYFREDVTVLPTTIKQQNNYLQINNTRVDELTVKELPEDARLQIENIINLYQKPSTNQEPTYCQQ